MTRSEIGSEPLEMIIEGSRVQLRVHCAIGRDRSEERGVSEELTRQRFVSASSALRQ
jgi:hypothetical protein